MEAGITWGLTKIRTLQNLVMAVFHRSWKPKSYLFFLLLFNPRAAFLWGKKKVQRVWLTARPHNDSIGFPANNELRIQSILKPVRGCIWGVFSFSEVATSRMVLNYKSVYISFTWSFCGIAREEMAIFSSTRVLVVSASIHLSQPCRC